MEMDKKPSFGAPVWPPPCPRRRKGHPTQLGARAWDIGLTSGRPGPPTFFHYGAQDPKCQNPMKSPDFWGNYGKKAKQSPAVLRILKPNGGFDS